MLEILEEFNRTNSSNDKLAVLKKHKDNPLLLRVLRLALDKVTFSFHIRKSPEVQLNEVPVKTLTEALDFLEFILATRKLTGNDAFNALSDILRELSGSDNIVVRRVLNRDLRINLGKTQILKVIPKLMPKPAYQRCSAYSPKLAKGLTYPAYIQLKADGRFVNVIVGDAIIFQSRSGEEQEFPELAKSFVNLTPGIYIGEMLVRGETNRAISNGLINSSSPPDSIYCQLWDYIEPNVDPEPYSQRFTRLQALLYNNLSPENNAELIPWGLVKDIPEALLQTFKWMEQGYEGAILKCPTAMFVDGTSRKQLKLKVVADCTVRITGFTEGTGKRLETFGAITFETDDGRVAGQCSGFTDDLLKDFNSRRVELVSQLMDVTFNDLTLADGATVYALSHPRFSGLRDDRAGTDTLGSIKDIVCMARGLEKL